MIRVHVLREPHKGVICPTGTILQSQTGEELSPSLRCGDASRKVNYDREGMDKARDRLKNFKD